jgi:hypothetical protein
MPPEFDISSKVSSLKRQLFPSIRFGTFACGAESSSLINESVFSKFLGNMLGNQKFENSMVCQTELACFASFFLRLNPAATVQI